MEQREIESILVADCGRARTKVTLIDLVEGRYRFVAQGEAPSTIDGDLILAVRRATDQIEEVTGRRFLDDEGWPVIPERYSGFGVDAFVATASAAPPLRTLLAGLAHDMSVESARQAIESTYAVVEEVVALDRGLQPSGGLTNAHALPSPDPVLAQTLTSAHLRWGQELATRKSPVSACQRSHPEAIVIVGGTDGGAIAPLLDLTRLMVPLMASTEASTGSGSTEPSGRASGRGLAEVSAEPLSRMASDEAKPTVIFAGNAEARLQVAEIVGGEADLRIVDNVRPSLEVENKPPLQEEVEEVYWERKMRRMPGFAQLRAWTSVSIPPAARAFAAVVRFLARHYGLTVAAVDLGGGATTVALANEGRFVTAMMTNAHPLLSPDGEALQEGPSLEGAEVRETLSLVWKRACSQWLDPGPDGELPPPLDLIIGSGGRLVRAPHYGQAALILLDALQPWGVSNLALDTASLMPSLGALVPCHPLAATQVLDQDCLLRLGPVIAPRGRARPGDLVLRLKIHRDDGSTEETWVPFGSMRVIPLPLGQTARLELRPSHHFDVGLGVQGRGAATRVKGGALGLIIDARGRPLVPPSEQERREWLAAMGVPVEG
ncbi:MAG: glutamate mutase L [Anaerolineae bacterium]